ncbi:two-component system sensor protein [Acidihalobacter prosperus]|uniref:Two-component system sensor protein n=1 Tax=Acidihalobacter prosperus TaxID=160660 RepID=A0A1A6C4U5_9GAMM|nr:two-component system sensor protein [Acidihalobacter prosperus]
MILMAELLAVILSLAHSGTGVHFWRALALTSLFIQWIALGSIAALCRLGPWLNRRPPVVAAAIAYVIVILVTLGLSALTALFLDWVVRPDNVNLDRDLQFLMRNTLISAIVTAVGLRYMYVQHDWKRSIEARTGARLAALQARIRPHFLFNSMNSIAALIRSRPAVAETAVLDLASVFRSVLEERDWSTLAEELELSRHYLSLEALRLGDRLRIEWRIEPGLDAARMPALSLQPLVENAVYHGIQPRPSGGTIRIDARRDGMKLVVVVENPLPGPDANPHRGNGMAVDNLRERLALAYDGRAKLVVEQDAERFSVQLRLPMEAKDARDDRG